MSNSESSERFGRPQIYALLLLLAFAAQCLWMAASRPLDAEERWYIEGGLRILSPQSQLGIPADNEHTPLVYLMAAAPVHWAGGWLPQDEAARGWLLRLPFLFFGMLRGASLWYVTRRLYGNRGGYLALALYCFSPRMVACLRGMSSSSWRTTKRVSGCGVQSMRRSSAPMRAMSSSGEKGLAR